MLKPFVWCKSHLFFLKMVSLVLLIGAGLIMISEVPKSYNKRMVDKNAVGESTRPISDALPAMSASPVPTPYTVAINRSKNRFIDSMYGYSFEYPAIWHAENNPFFAAPQPLPNGSLEGRALLDEPSAMCHINVFVGITQGNAKDHLFEDQYKKIGTSENPATEEVVNIAGAVAVWRTYAPDNRAVREFRTTLLLPRERDIIAFHLINSLGRCQKVYDDIVQSINLN